MRGIGILVMVGLVGAVGCSDAGSDDESDALRELDLDSCNERGALPQYELAGDAVDELTESPKELTAQWMEVASEGGVTVVTLVTDTGAEATLTLPADPGALDLPELGAEVTLRSFVGFPESGAVNNVSVSDARGLVARVVFAERFDTDSEFDGFTVSRATSLCRRPADDCNRVLVDDTVRFELDGVGVELSPGEDTLHTVDTDAHWIYLRTAGHREYGVYAGECEDETAPWVGYVIVRARS
jgi:hypothetical protein